MRHFSSGVVKQAKYASARDNQHLLPSLGLACPCARLFSRVPEYFAHSTILARESEGLLVIVSLTSSIDKNRYRKTVR